MLISFNAIGQQPLKKIILTNSKQNHTIHQTHLSQLTSHDTQKELNVLWKAFKKNEFLKTENNFLEYNFLEPSIWFAFSVQSRLKEEVWINLHNSAIDSIHLYKLDKSGDVMNLEVLGNTFYKTAQVYKTYSYWFPLIDANDTNTYQYFLKVYTPKIFETPIEVGSKEALFHSRIEQEFYATFFIGALIIMLLYNLINFIFTRDRIYIFYTLYIGWALLCTTFINSYPIIESIIGANFAYDKLIVWTLPLYIFIVLFTSDFLQLDKTLPIFRNWLFFIMAAISSLALLNLFIPVTYLMDPLLYIGTLFIISCLVAAIVVSMNGKMRATLHVAGWLILLLSIGIHLMVINGLLSHNSFSGNIIYLGLILQVLFFSASLAERVSSLSSIHKKLNLNLQKTIKELKLSNDALDTINYHISHNVKTVLTNAKSLSLLIQKYTLNNNQAKVMEVAGKLNVMTTNGLDSTNKLLQQGISPLIFKSNETTDIIINAEVTRILNDYDLKDKIRIQFDCEKSTPFKFNRKAFESVLLNLLTNSIKYNTQQPKAHLKTFQRFNKFILEYSDNGIGIDLNRHGEKLFKPFYRFSNHRETTGSGLGLYLINQIIVLAGGEISIESQLDKGTKFTIELPIFLAQT